MLALMRRGRGRSEGINGEEDFARDQQGGLIDVSATPRSYPAAAWLR
jgi:hypothetical protein